jgi:hypothetical protein
MGIRLRAGWFFFSVLSKLLECGAGGCDSSLLGIS